MTGKTGSDSGIFDLIPKDRLVRYLKAAAEGWGLPIRLLDAGGATVMREGLLAAACGFCPTNIWDRMEEVLAEGPVELALPEGCSLMAAPIHFKGELLGYLAACEKAAEGGDCHYRAMLSLSASHVEGLAEAGYEIESLSAEVVRVYEELALIYGVTARLGTKVELGEICRSVADEVEKVLNPTSIMLQLADEAGGVLKTIFASGEHRQKAMNFAPGLEEGLTGRAFVSHRTVLVCDVSKDRRHTDWPFPVTSLLSVPIVAEERSLGVISATDKKDGSEFGSREEKLVSAIASVAAIAIKNAQLYSEIKGLLEGFINASVLAVESRDPTTAGHSERVALMTVELARKVDASDLPVFKGVTFTPEQLLEMRYAGLLHDFGKLGVRESVLLKGAKLHPQQLELIKARFAYIKERKTREALEKKLGVALGRDREACMEASRMIDSELEAESALLDKYMGLIEAADNPHVLLTDLPELERLDEAARESYTGPSGEARPILTPFEFKALHVLRGSLNDEERREVEQHVTHSFNFLIKIPWTRSFPNIAGMVHAHHEKLDGSGYPLGLTAERIPIEAKMMAVADIFDALTAWDRPYKKAVSTQKALFILDMEVAEGKLEPHLVQIFRDAKVYECALGIRPRVLRGSDGG